MDVNKIIMSIMSKLEKDKVIYHDKYVSLIPDMIDIKSDKEIWGCLYNILYVYLDMVQEFTLEDYEFELYLDDMIYYHEKLRELSTKEKNLMISMYIHGFYNHILEWCIDSEYYEGAYNLKKLEELS
jgi:hypothetical protein